MTTMLFTDLNNHVTASAFSVLLQEHLEAIRLGNHLIPNWRSCFACARIRTLAEAGVLSGIIYNGLYDIDLRPYDADTGDWLDAWWDWKTDSVDETWLKNSLK